MEQAGKHYLVKKPRSTRGAKSWAPRSVDAARQWGRLADPCALPGRTPEAAADYAGTSCRPQLRTAYFQPCTSPEPVAIVILRERTSSRHFGDAKSATASARIARKLCLGRRGPALQDSVDLGAGSVLDPAVLHVDVEGESAPELACEAPFRGCLGGRLPIVALDALELKSLDLRNFAEGPEAGQPGLRKSDL